MSESTSHKSERRVSAVELGQRWDGAGKDGTSLASHHSDCEVIKKVQKADVLKLRSPSEEQAIKIPSPFCGFSVSSPSRSAERTASSSFCFRAI